MAARDEQVAVGSSSPPPPDEIAAQRDQPAVAVSTEPRMRMARGRAGSGLATAPQTGPTGQFDLDIETSDCRRFTSAKLVSGMAVPSSTPRPDAGASSSDAAVGGIAHSGSSVTPPGRPALAGPTAVQAHGQSPRAARRSTSACVPSGKLRPEPRGRPGAADQQRSGGRCQADHPIPYGRRQATACSNIVDLLSCGYTRTALGLSANLLVPVWQSGSAP